MSRRDRAWHVAAVQAERRRVAVNGDGPRRRILLKDVAQRANVSGSTASRALADDQRISIGTREAVKIAAAELHYVPNAAARSLRVRRTRTLGLLLPDLRDPCTGRSRRRSNRKPASRDTA